MFACWLVHFSSLLAGWVPRLLPGLSLGHHVMHGHLWPQEWLWPGGSPGLALVSLISCWLAVGSFTCLMSSLFSTTPWAVICFTLWNKKNPFSLQRQVSPVSEACKYSAGLSSAPLVLLLSANLPATLICLLLLLSSMTSLLIAAHLWSLHCFQQHS